MASVSLVANLKSLSKVKFDNGKCGVWNLQPIPGPAYKVKSEVNFYGGSGNLITPWNE